MDKLIRGIIDFRNRILPERRLVFSELAKGQNPDALFITCSDSRVAPNWFASTDPGDLFVVRSVGNLIPVCADNTKDIPVVAAVEYAVNILRVTNIILCGHSECGAMQALMSSQSGGTSPHLTTWLQNGSEGLADFKAGRVLDPQLSPLNQLSQVNVLKQIEHLKTFPMIQEALRTNELRIHGWWFDIATADVFRFDDRSQKFVLIQ